MKLRIAYTTTCPAHRSVSGGSATPSCKHVVEQMSCSEFSGKGAGRGAHWADVDTEKRRRDTAHQFAERLRRPAVRAALRILSGAGSEEGEEVKQNGMLHHDKGGGVDGVGWGQTMPRCTAGPC